MRCLALLACLLLAGCEGSLLHSQQRQERAKAEIAEAWARCLARYENDPEKLKSVCAVYNQALLQLDVKGMK